jgi:hypothetical protein
MFRLVYVSHQRLFGTAYIVEVDHDFDACYLLPLPGIMAETEQQCPNLHGLLLCCPPCKHQILTRGIIEPKDITDNRRTHGELFKTRGLP